MEHDTCRAHTVPTFLSRKALHARLKPELKPLSFANWLGRAVAKWGFPEPVRFGARGVSWREDEVIAWLDSRPRGGRFDGRRSGRGEAA